VVGVSEISFEVQRTMLTFEAPVQQVVRIEQHEIVLQPVAEQGLPGPKGEKGDQGLPGSVAATLPWSNVTDKPDLVEDSEIIDGGNF
jgi:hypothetical protein